MDVLSSRILLRPSVFEDAVRWYRDVLGLHVYREYGAAGRVTGVVFFLGGGFLELVGDSSSVSLGGGALWLQVASSAHPRRSPGVCGNAGSPIPTGSRSG